MRTCYRKTVYHRVHKDETNRANFTPLHLYTLEDLQCPILILQESDISNDLKCRLYMSILPLAE